jgi:phosphoglycerate dehydrogenase-like enzyme
LVKALLLETPKPEQLSKLTQLFSQVEFSMDLKAAADAEIVLGWRSALKDTLLANPNLKWVQARSAGVDYLPLSEFNRKKILLTNASGLHSRYIAETVTAYILMENRGLREVIKQPGKWFEPAVFESSEQTALIFGTGKIGCEIARYCRFLGMQVLGVNRHGMDESLLDIFDSVMTMSQYQNLQQPLKVNFLVSVLPGTAQTKDFFDHQMFLKCQPGYTFINVGRGNTVVQKDLVALLAENQLRSAYLDVFAQEPLDENSILNHHSKIFVTPHISGLLPHFRRELFPLFADNLNKYLNHQPLRNIVNLRAGY